MKNRIITISREFGSGGRTIGRLTARKLGIPCYDQELIEKIAEKSGFAKEYTAEKSEDAPFSSWFANAFSDHSYNGFSSQDYLWKAQCDVIWGLAKKESCVIVGRCADYILKDHADCLTVFIHADMEARAKRIVKLYGETEQIPEKRLREKDKKRSTYYRFYTDMEWGVAKNYQISLNSAAFGIETCVELLAGLY